MIRRTVFPLIVVALIVLSSFTIYALPISTSPPKPTTVEVIHDQGKIIQHSQNNYTLYNSRIAYNIAFNGSITVCRILNNTVSSPWLVKPISPFFGYAVQYYSAGWKVDAVSSNSIATLTNATGAYLFQKNILASGSKFNVTYIVKTDGWLKWEIAFTSGKTQQYRLTYRMDNIPLNWVNNTQLKHVILRYTERYNLTFMYDDIKDIPYRFQRDDANRRIYLFIGEVQIPVGHTVYIDPSTVATTTESTAIERNYPRISFFAQGHIWEFYKDGANGLLYRTSSDGVTWSAATVASNAVVFDNEAHISVYTNGTHVMVTYSRGSCGTIKFRQGLLNEGGATITWDAAAQTINGALGGAINYIIAGVYDSSGYAWIAYSSYNDSTGAYDVHAYKNSVRDGTWATETASTYNEWGGDRYCAITPLTDGKIYLTRRNDLNIVGHLYTGTWGTSESIGSAGDYFGGECITNFGDDVFFSWHDGTDIKFNIRAYGVGWGSAETPKASYAGWPALSVDDSTGNAYIFYQDTASDHVYYKIRNYGTSTWGSEVDWIDESTDGILSNSKLSTFHQNYTGIIGLSYMTKTGSPYNIRFAYVGSILGGGGTTTTVTTTLTTTLTTTTTETETETETETSTTTETNTTTLSVHDPIGPSILPSFMWEWIALGVAGVLLFATLKEPILGVFSLAITLTVFAYDITYGWVYDVAYSNGTHIISETVTVALPMWYISIIAVLILLEVAITLYGVTH